MMHVKYLRSHCEYTFAALDCECAGWKTSFRGCEHGDWFPSCDCDEAAIHSEFVLSTTGRQNERLALMLHYLEGSESIGLSRLSDQFRSIQGSLAGRAYSRYNEHVRQLQASIRGLSVEEKQDLSAFCELNGIKPPAFK
jgi:hypothetical protein